MRGAKSGPDYIDPRFHEAACGQPCLNLDAWAMTPARIRGLAAADDLLLIEGAMGLFDGAPPDGKGATADLARILDLPVILVVDAARMAQSVAPLVAGFRATRPGGSNRRRHPQPGRQRTGTTRCCARPLLRRSGCRSWAPCHDRTGWRIRRAIWACVQAAERADLDDFLDRAADVVEAACDLDRPGLSHAAALTGAAPAPPMPPPAQTIALARDTAFAFAYPHLLADWRAEGAEIMPFSPLADDPVPPADLVILPGGYPELHAGRLSANMIFMQSLRIASQKTDIYGECGGYMVLGEALTDANGVHHPMAGLLPLETSFATRKLHLGYRRLVPRGGPFQAR